MNMNSCPTGSTHSCETQLTTVINVCAKARLTLLYWILKKPSILFLMNSLNANCFKLWDRWNNIELDKCFPLLQTTTDSNKWCSGWASVALVVSQGTVLGSLLFSLYINDISVHIQTEIRRFADDCVCYREINTEEDTLKLQRDIDRSFKQLG